jgi:hypothetical protein
VTFVVAWAAISAFVAALAVGNRNLAKRLNRFETNVARPPSDAVRVKPAA